MKILLALLVLVSQSPLYAQDRLPITCTERCQYFDDFNNECNYRTHCDYSNHCMTLTSCERWDNFNQRCLSQKEETNCHAPNPFLPAPNCTSECQYFDNFNGTCLYKTQCWYFQTCVQKTQCEKWDHFNNLCMSDESKTTCN